MAADLSVVVVSLNALGLLTRCLDTLVALEDTGLDVIVVRDWSPRTGPPRALVERFPRARWTLAPPRATVPAMRWFGIEAAQGAIVALIEDDCLVEPGWAAAIRLALTQPAVAVGGAVEPDEYRALLDWGVYFCEYGRFMAPLPERETADLAGMNVAYKQHALATLGRQADGFHDLFVHWEWRRQGRTLRATNAFAVRNVNAWHTDHVTSSPYHHGRAFAGRRFAGLPLWRRLLFAIGAAVVLVPLKTTRIMAVVFRRRRHRARFVGALPWVVLFNAAWTCGEIVGCLRGPGSSAARWR